MMVLSSIPRDRDASLWLIAAGISLLLNGVVILVMAFFTLNEWIYEVPPPRAVEETRSMTIQPVMREEEEPAVAVEEEPVAFARTMESQEGPAPEDAPFIGERDTQAKSESEPVDDGDEILPSQDGIEPRVAGEVETTESDYQDGNLAHRNPGSRAATPVPPRPVAPETTANPAAESTEPPPPPAAEQTGPDEVVEGKRTELAETPFPYELPVRPDEDEADEPKASKEPDKTTDDQVAEGKTEKEIEAEAKQAKTPAKAKPSPQPPNKSTASAASEPGFRGFQRKTQLKGSISRRGKSSLDVESGALGTYHSAISRAIEKAWQREAISNRDYITPGVIRVRVVLDVDGEVRSVGTVDEFGIGAIQRGFTHRAIRQAELPEMPAEVKKELDGEPLELLYNFIF